MLSVCTFNYPAISSSDGLVQPIVGETDASTRFTFVCQWEVETPTPEKDVTHPSDSPTLFDLTCQLICTVNVKWWEKNVYIL